MELEFVRWLRETLPGSPDLLVGPGDDAAVLRIGATTDAVWTVDTLMEGVDFRWDSATPEQVGRKALAVNLSDLAAMAARPTAALVSLVLPRQNGLEIGQRLILGMLPLAREFGVALAGGDTNSWDGPLVVTVTLLGQTSARGPLLRSGAQPGDVLCVTGPCGGSIVHRHLDFTPRVAEALWLHERYDLHAGIDVSDGLSLDLARVLAASGCGAEVDAAQIPLADDAIALARAGGPSALERALSDGEDFELLLAIPPAEADRLFRDPQHPAGMARIGRCLAGEGMWLVGADGTRIELTPRGYVHG